MRIDVTTIDKTRLGYARLMIEVQVGQDLPDKFYFKDKKGMDVSVSVEYGWRPDISTDCTHWHGINNNFHHPGGRILIIWVPQMFDIKLIDCTTSQIATEVTDIASGDVFWFIVVYVLNFNERLGRPVVWDEIANFRHCVDYWELLDIQAKGSFFTWNNKQDPSTRVFYPLDMLLVSNERMQLYPESYAFFMNEGLFYHSPIICYRRHSCHLGKLLLDTLICGPDNSGIIQAEKEAARNYYGIQKACYIFLQQKAKIDWLMEGDENTTFYLRKIKATQVQNKVLLIKDIHGRSHNEPEAIEKVFLDYYKEFLGNSKTVNQVHIPTVRSGNLVSDQHVTILLSPVSFEEVKQCFFSIPSSKSPGPDGYTRQFFCDSWDIVGKDLFTAIQKILLMEKSSNKSHS
ncbi:uncharacterized protein LOC141658243 [Silene latifolia]|uniref:uncharacterized protein LOC141658243 n=1 Tax=Silene latifolia TaxID=37657 RepID=UPI003D76D235